MDIAGGFYNHLGQRSWVFSGYLYLNRMESASCVKSDDEAEATLISYLREDDVLTSQVRRLNKYPDMRPRMHLLKKTTQNYIEERHYNSVLITVSIADGFVNDINKSSEKRLACENIRGNGNYHQHSNYSCWLPAFQKIFSKTVGSRIDEEVHEAMWHGLIHRMLTDYNNVYVASKA